MRVLLIAAAVAAGATAQAFAADRLAGDELEKAVSGKRVYLATPFGGEFPLSYKTDGTVDGSGEAIGLGRFMRPTDSGRWWVAGDKLCQKWKSWYDGKQFCFTVSEQGKQRISWVRDDGLSGTARVSE